MSDLNGRRVLITGAARGIGAALAERLHQRGARVAIVGLEEELLASSAARCGDAWWTECDVTDREAVEEAVEGAVAELGGLDVVVANAGVAAQLPIVGGDPEVMERTLAVNVLGVYYTLRAAGPHISHPGGYALPIASRRRGPPPPDDGRLLRVEGGGRGARELAPDRAQADGRARGRGLLRRDRHRHDEPRLRHRGRRRADRRLRPFMRVAPLHVAIDALERGIARRARRVVAPRSRRAAAARCGWPCSRSSTVRSSATSRKRSTSRARSTRRSPRRRNERRPADRAGRAKARSASSRGRSRRWPGASPAGARPTSS